MKVFYNDDYCGAGKTEYMTRRVATIPGLYVYATDRVETMDQLEGRIAAQADVHQTKPIVRRIFSCRTQHGGVANVRKALGEANAELGHRAHVVLIVTHAALASLTTSAWSDWELFIDETPTLVSLASYTTVGAASWEHFESHYDLLPTGVKGYSKVEPKPSAPTAAGYERDTFLADLADFTRTATGRFGLYVALDSWEEAKDETWTWISVFDFEALSVFKRVTVMANGFTKSVTYKVTESLNPSVEFERVPLPSGLQWQPRTVTIRYFSEDARAGTGYFSGVGKDFLGHVWQWISVNSEPSNHFFSHNTKCPPSVPVNGQPVTPRVAGRNDLRDYTVCSMIYAARPDKGMVRMFDTIGISEEDVVASWEGEDLVQFITRTSYRVPHDTRDIEFRVFDKWQAEYVADFIRSLGMPFKVETVFQPLDSKAPDNGKAGRPKGPAKTAEEVREAARLRQAKRREKLKLEKCVAATNAKTINNFVDTSTEK